MSSEFYRAFEDRHRGSRELILSRLEVYLPFIEKLKEFHNPCKALDLGCGRGEWLQLLQSNGVQARGVDLDQGMLQACHELNLKAEQGDAIATLLASPDNSLSIVSGFHIVEHIDFAQVQQLVEQALRVLKPGGLLILETPNAENLVVGTNNFYLDPTHLRPLPHTLLAFVTELAGFSRNKVLRLQEDPALHQHPPGLIQVLGGVSPDYAVVAQKPADSNTMASFDQVFSHEYGISINQIAERYDQALTNELKALQARLHQLAIEEDELRALVQQTAERAATAEQQNQQMNSELHKAELRTVQLETLAEQLRQQLLQATQRLYQEEAHARQLEGELREASTRTAQLEARSEITQNQLQSQAEQQHQLTQQLLTDTRRIQELQYQLKHSQQLRVKAEEEIADLSEQLAEATDQIASLNNQAEVHAKAWAEKLTEKLAEQSAAAEEQFAAQLNSTTEQFNQQLEQTTQQLNESLGNAHNWYIRATELEAELNSTKDELHNVHQANHQHWEQLQESLGNAHHWYLRATEAEQHHSAAQQRINDLLHSTSWKITAPLRGLRRLIAWLLALPFRAIKLLLRPLLSRAIRFALNRPALRQRWVNRLRKYPKVFAHLRQFAINRGLVIAQPITVAAPVQVSSPVRPAQISVASAARQKQETTNIPLMENHITRHGEGYYLNSDRYEDGNVTVDQILSGIRRELIDYREGSE